MARTVYRSSEDVDAMETWPMVTFDDLLRAAREDDEQHAIEQAAIDERTDYSGDVEQF